MISEDDNDRYLAEILEILKERLGDGDKSALLHAIYFCGCLMNRPLPEWLRFAFWQAYEAQARFEIRSWDEIFGRPVPKSTHLKTEKRNAELRLRIIMRVEELSRELPRDKGLFEKIAGEIGMEGVKGTTVSDIYYEARSQKLRELMNCLPSSGNF